MSADSSASESRVVTPQRRRLRDVSARWIGIVLLAASIALNRWTIGLLSGGRIDSLHLNLAILTVQLIIAGTGIWFLRTRPRYSPQLALAAGALAAAVLVVDLVAATTGVLIPRHFTERQRIFYGLFQPDPQLGHRLTPDLIDYRVTWSEASMSIAYSTDALGFRNCGRDYDDSRLWFIGDSFAFGDWVDRGGTFFGVLESMLGEPTISLGVSGYGVTQYGILAQRHQPARRPAVVAICIFANDLTSEPTAEELHDKYAEAGWDAYESAPLTARLFSGRIVKELLAIAGRDVGIRPPSSGRFAWAENDVRLFLFRGADTGYFEDSLFVDTEERLRDLIAEISSVGLTPIVFLLPSKESTYKDEYVRLFGIEYLSIEEEGFGRIADLCADLSVPCEDLTTAFRDRGRRDVLYFARDPHWNERGHALAAEVMAPIIRDALAEPATPER